MTRFLYSIEVSSPYPLSAVVFATMLSLWLPAESHVFGAVRRVCFPNGGHVVVTVLRVCLPNGSHVFVAVFRFCRARWEQLILTLVTVFCIQLIEFYVLAPYSQRLQVEVSYTASAPLRLSAGGA